MLLRRHLSNISGWRTKRKIVVFESDDWGSIRMPDKAVLEHSKKTHLDLFEGEGARYNSLDSLETLADIRALCEIIGSVKDKNGNPLVFTLLFNTGNPDFEKIKASNFNSYVVEDFQETYKRFGLHETLPELRNGIQQKLLLPQFHGREHLNVSIWLNNLKNKDSETLTAFDLGIWGYNNQNKYSISYQAAFDLAEPNEIDFQKEVIKSGLEIFERTFGLKARYFVPPNGPLNFSLLPHLAEQNIDILSVAKRHLEPLGHGNTRLLKHKLGMQNKFGQIYLTRNATFEPSDKRKDWVDSCMKEASIAFLWGKPLVISTHRVNYVGGIDSANRINGLKELKKLLTNMISKWPDIEFMSSVELADTIRNNHVK